MLEFLPGGTTGVAFMQQAVGSLEPLKPEDDWEVFLERLEIYMDAHRIKRSSKVSALLMSLSVEVYQILRQLCSPYLPKTKTYDDLVDLLKNEFHLKHSVYRKRILFDSLKQGEEPIEEWYAKVVYIAVQCKFENTLEERVKDKFVCGMKPGLGLDELCEEDVDTDVKYLLDLMLKKENSRKMSSMIHNKKPKMCRRPKLSRLESEQTESLTEDSPRYKFYQNIHGYMKFKVRASNDALIALSTTADAEKPEYEICIGGLKNTQSVIQKNHTTPNKVEESTLNILSEEQFRNFWVSWSNNTISVGWEGVLKPFISWTDNEFVPIRYIGFSTGQGATGTWIFTQEEHLSTPFNDDVQIQPIGEKNWEWVATSTDSIPKGGFVGGHDRNSRLYVIRCEIDGELVPGKLHSGYKTAYVPWNGFELEFTECEMLCNCNAKWIAGSQGHIPANAICGGNSQDGRHFYIGRAHHDGTLAVGRVDPLHGCCYIPYGGKEYCYTNYEILVS